MFTLRLKPELENRIREAAARYEVTASEFVRRALEEKLDQDASAAHPYALGKHVFGRFSSEEGDRAEQGERYLRDKLRGKRSG